MSTSCGLASPHIHPQGNVGRTRATDPHERVRALRCSARRFDRTQPRLSSRPKVSESSPSGRRREQWGKVARNCSRRVSELPTDKNSRDVRPPVRLAAALESNARVTEPAGNGLSVPQAPRSNGGPGRHPSSWTRFIRSAGPSGAPTPVARLGRPTPMPRFTGTCVIALGDGLPRPATPTPRGPLLPESCLDLPSRGR